MRLEHREHFVKHGNKSVEEKWDMIGKLMEAELQKQQEKGVEPVLPGGHVPERVPTPHTMDPQWFSGKRLYDRVCRLDVKSKEVRCATVSCVHNHTLDLVCHHRSLTTWEVESSFYVAPFQTSMK